MHISSAFWRNRGQKTQLSTYYLKCNNNIRDLHVHVCRNLNIIPHSVVSLSFHSFTIISAHMYLSLVQWTVAYFSRQTSSPGLFQITKFDKTQSHAQSNSSWNTNITLLIKHTYCTVKNLSYHCAKTAGVSPVTPAI